MAEALTVTRWRRYGKDRLYVSAADGVRVGWHDLLTGQTQVEANADRDAVEAAISCWRESALSTASEAMVPQRATAVSAVTAASSSELFAAVGPPDPVVTDLATTSGSAGPNGEQESPPIREEPAAAVEDWEDLALRPAGAEAREQAVTLRQTAPVRTFLARVLGVHTDERAWRIGARWRGEGRRPAGEADQT